MANNLFQKKGASKALEEPPKEQQTQEQETVKEEPVLPETAITYCRNSKGQWQLVTLKFNMETGEAKVESLGEANHDKETIRERYIIESVNKGLLS